MITPISLPCQGEKIWLPRRVIYVVTPFQKVIISNEIFRNHLLGEAKDEALRVIFFCLRFHSSISMDTGKDVALSADLFQIE